MATDLFEALDYLYLPAPEIEAAIAFYTEALGGELLWRIRHGETWVAAIRLGSDAPLVVLANHLQPGQGLLIYRARSLADTQRALASHGWRPMSGSAPAWTRISKAASTRYRPLPRNPRLGSPSFVR